MDYMVCTIIIINYIIELCLELFYNFVLVAFAWMCVEHQLTFALFRYSCAEKIDCPAFISMVMTIFP